MVCATILILFTWPKTKLFAAFFIEKTIPSSKLPVLAFTFDFSIQLKEIEIINFVTSLIITAEKGKRTKKMFI